MRDMTEFQEVLRFLTRVLAGDSPLDYVIRGHLYIEAELTRLIELALPYPKALNLDDDRGFGYHRKVSLAVALGCLAAEERGAYGRLNALRNNFAHNLNHEVREKDHTELVAALGPDTRAAYDELSASIPPDSPVAVDSLKLSITAMWLVARTDRMWSEDNPELAPYLRDDRTRRRGLRAVKDDESPRSPQ